MIFVLVVSGCLQVTSPEERARENADMARIDLMTESILQSFNSGSYIDFKRDLSGSVKIQMSEEQFSNLRLLISQSSGSYMSKSFINVTHFQGYSQYAYNCVFEKENITARFSVDPKKVLINGLYFDSENIRASS